MQPRQTKQEIEVAIEESLSAALDELESLDQPKAPVGRRRPPPLPGARPASSLRPMRAWPPPLPKA